MSILLFNKNLIEQVIVLLLLPSSGSTNKKLPVSTEDPFLCTTGLTAKGLVGAEMK